jgi:hypothetical protein
VALLAVAIHDHVLLQGHATVGDLPYEDLCVTCVHMAAKFLSDDVSKHRHDDHILHIWELVDMTVDELIHTEWTILKTIKFTLPLHQCLWWHLSVEQQNDHNVIAVCKQVVRRSSFYNLGVARVAQACALYAQLNRPTIVIDDVLNLAFLQ